MMESVLGVPDFIIKKKKKGNTPLKRKSIDSCCSKIGGYAIWHDESSAPALADLICQSCGKYDNLVLVCQIYAPIEDLHRSLYLFACNRRVCSLTSKGWVVVRNQKREVSAALTSPILESSEKKPTVEETSSASSIWDFASLNTVGEGDDDLLQLLAQRDTKVNNKVTPVKQNSKGTSKGQRTNSSSKKSKTPASVTKPLPTDSPDIPTSPLKESELKSDKKNQKELILETPTVLPEILVSEVEDYCVDTSKDIVGLEGLDDDEDFDNDQSSDLPVVDDQHIQRLLESYLKDEDDAESLRALEAYRLGQLDAPEINIPQSKKKERNGLLDDEDDNHFLSNVKKSKQRKDNPKSKPGRKTSSSKATESDSDDNEDGADVAMEEKVLLARKEKVERCFQQRIQQEPNQVLRYAYGAQPAWITYPFPSISDIASCPVCNSPRVYECQLMPALLSFISSSGVVGQKSPAPSDKSMEASIVSDSESLKDPTALSMELQSRLGDGLDFGVVTVWSCPNSCSSEGKDSREVVIVQPSPDFTF